MRVRTLLLFLLLLLCLPAPALAESETRSCKVLAVMSYHDGYPWQDEIRKGMERILHSRCRITFFNLDTKHYPEQGEQRAAEAYALFSSMRPDGVLAADDPAQELFVVPYLREKTSVPVFFCGVNANAEKYGYPASNVTGILERYHGKETMAFLKQIMPKVQSFVYLSRGNDMTAAEIISEIRKDAPNYALRAHGFYNPATIEEAADLLRAARPTTDVLYLEHLEGITDRSGRILSHREAYTFLLDVWGNKPTVCANEYSVKAGCLLAVQKSGVEQGAMAAKMLLRALEGTPLAQIPIVRNQTGVKILNVQAMTKLGITVPLPVFREIKLVRTDGN